MRAGEFVDTKKMVLLKQEARPERSLVAGVVRRRRAIRIPNELVPGGPMKKMLALVIPCLLLPSPGVAAWTPNGVNVSGTTPRHFVRDSPRVVSDGADGAILAWRSIRDFPVYEEDVAVGRVDSSGVVLWAGLVCNVAGLQRYPGLIDDNAGGAIVVWHDERVAGAGPGIYAQRFDASGVEQWQTDGVLVAMDDPFVFPPYYEINVVGDGAGGAYIAWGSDDAEVHVQHVLFDGSLPWTITGKPVTVAPTNDKSLGNMVSDGSGGVLVVWQQWVTNQLDILAQRLDPAGALQWGFYGYPVCDQAEDQEGPRMVATNSGGAVVVWNDLRGGDSALYAQSLSSSGSRQWALDGVHVSGVGPEVSEGSARIAPDGNDGAFIVWTDDRYNSFVSRDLIAAHVDFLGVPTNPPYTLSVPQSMVLDANVAHDGADGAFVTWQLQAQQNGYQADDIRAQWIDPVAGTLFASGGVTLCDADSVQRLPHLVAASSGGRAIVAWNDDRDMTWFNDMYAQVLEGNTAVGDTISVAPVDKTTGNTPVTVTFSGVSTPGATTLTTSPVGPPLPGGFELAGHYYDLWTNATYTAPVEVCIVYDPLLVTGSETDVNLMHHDGSMWVDITTSVDTLANVVCGTTTSLSPFAIAEPDIPDGVGDVSLRQFALHANVPNPFNPATTIRYDIPAGGANVNISIYDLSGRRVRELVNERRPAGTWSVQWNGIDDRGQRVASGVYFYRMRAGAFVDTKKMVLLK